MKIIIGFIILGIIFFFMNGGLKGIKRNVSRLFRPLFEILTRGYKNGYLILRIPRSKGYLKIIKYINKPKDYGIKLEFKNEAEWEKTRFIVLEEYRINQKIEYTKCVIDGIEVIYIDFKQDVEYALRVVQEVLKMLFDIDENGFVFVSMENGSPRMEVIDR